ncbi:MAG: helix-turn-helix domain-containing protein [Opitutaceae bacterium]|nr:helix-turn-helix domain-containing protein [Cephaloticoccus sp.]MCP5530483.1 helix-turn-helix domain-containing protein [Opitutaceae bacterium]
MTSQKVKALEAARAKIAQLEEAVEKERAKELASLPAKFGFSSATEFIAAVKAAAGGRSGSKTKSGKRRQRAVIDDKVKATVKKLTEEGKTGAEIAEAAGISVPSVQNIKKELGLVRSKGKKK